MNLLTKLNQGLVAFRNLFKNHDIQIRMNPSRWFSCFYPGAIGFLGSRLLNMIFSRIQLDDKKRELLFQLNEKGIVIYTGKYKTAFEFHYYHTILKQSALPYPEVGFDFKFFLLQPVTQVFRILWLQAYSFFTTFRFKDPYLSGYMTDELLRGRSGFIYLIESNAFYKRFVKSKPDPLILLITLQKQIDRPIFFIPQAIVFSTKPVRTTPTLLDILLGSNERPGKISRILSLFKNPDKISVEMAEPLNLMAFLQRPEIRTIDLDFQAYHLRSYLIDQLNRQRRCVIGPVLKSKEELTEDILTQESLQTFMKNRALEKNEPLVQTRKRAASYISEIAANYNLTIIYMFEKLLTWAFGTIFEGLVVDQDGLQRVKQETKKSPVILVPCHKSHLDYLLLSYIMFKNSMPCPHIAAGHNLSFWPLGYFFRGAGAFFLRRTFKGAVLYSRIFAAYIEKLLQEGFNIEFFIEGGRSRTGKLLAPKLGFLSMLLEAHRNRVCDDLLFIPIYVGYDRVLEEDAYLNEIEGGKKNPESLLQLIKARKFLKKKYGKVYIKFDQSISLNRYMEDQGFNAEAMDGPENKKLCQNLGYRLINAINSISIVTPHGIIASAVLNCPGNRFSKRDLMFRVETYMSLLTYINAELADTLAIDPDNAFNLVIDNFVNRKFIELADESEKEVSDTTRFIVKDNKRPILDYYKNNAIAFFIPAAYTAISILKTDTFQFSSTDLILTYTLLEEFFIDEFSFDEETQCIDEINKYLRAFTNDGIIVPNPSLQDTYNLTSEGYRKLKCLAGFLNPFLESYKAALAFFEQNGPDIGDDKERIKKIQSIGVKMYKRQDILLKESLSKINYINACTFFMKNNTHLPEQGAVMANYREFIDDLLAITATHRP
ncbi:MAG: 1-acyl-sn-glycerol-3-phosphate acyltransferase [Pseudomonadota bacterium]